MPRIDVDDRLCVTIDGPSGVGKSTLGRSLSDRLAVPFWDAGLTFRAVAAVVMAEGGAGAPEDVVGRLTATPYRGGVEEERLVDGTPLGPALWAPDLAPTLFAVAADEALRAAVLAFHRRTIDRPSIVAGRDVGSAVFPTASLKVRLRASDEVRARRRDGRGGDGRVRTPQEPQGLIDRWEATIDGVLDVDTDPLTADEVLALVLGALAAARDAGTARR